jgi:hypothetical protein
LTVPYQAVLVIFVAVMAAPGTAHGQTISTRATGPINTAPGIPLLVTPYGAVQSSAGSGSSAITAGAPGSLFFDSGLVQHGAAGGIGLHVTSGGPVASITNRGILSAIGPDGRTLAIDAGGHVGTLRNSGTIAGSTAIASAGTIGSIVNRGQIFGTVDIQNQNLSISGGIGRRFGSFSGNINIANGDLLFASGNLTLAADITANGGSRTVTNAGILRLATHQTLSGNFTQTADGVLDLGITGTGTGQFGSLSISDNVSLAGELSLKSLGDVTLAAGDSIDILDFATLLGNFDTFSLDGVSCVAGNSGAWDCANLSDGQT